MSFAISPFDYLSFLREELSAYEADPLSLKRAIIISLFANHIGEHVFAAYSTSDPGKVDGFQLEHDYRNHLASSKPELAIVRDICDYSKHGPTLHRKTVQVSGTGIKQALVPNFQGLLALTNHTKEERIVVTLLNGSELFFDWLIADVVRFWENLFASKKL